jgi:hypothetical protein
MDASNIIIENSAVAKSRRAAVKLNTITVKRNIYLHQLPLELIMCIT